MSPVGVVIIGRNEGERLRRCLGSVAGGSARVVYVDSGSTDGSVELARGMGVEVVELDMSRPFTAARARNAGFERLMELGLGGAAHPGEPGGPGVEFVQFVDGDCELAAGWLGRAAEEMRRNERAAVVVGRLRERFPESSVYNRLCDMEWERPMGRLETCGGIAMMRAAAFRAAGGFDGRIIAGEEPELCARLRRAGGEVWRIDAEMGLHDAAMTRFGQWWRRAVRNGHAYAEAAALQPGAGGRYGGRAVWSIVLWGAVFPVVVAATAWPTGGWSALGLLAYPLMALRVARGRVRRGDTWRAGLLYGAFTMMGKFPNMLGVTRYRANRLLGRGSRLIEYKGAGREAESPGAGEGPGVAEGARRT